MIEPPEFARLVAYARGRRDGAVGQSPLECVAPLAVGAADTHAQIEAQVERWTAAGATAFHVGFVHSGLDHLLERMAMFADAVGLEAQP